MGEAPRLLKAEYNPALKNLSYTDANEKTISAFDRLNYIFCQVSQAEDIQRRTLSAALGTTFDFDEQQMNAELSSFLTMLPDPCKIFDFSQCMTPSMCTC